MKEDDFDEDLEAGSRFIWKFCKTIFIPLLAISFVVGGIYEGCNLLSTPARLADKTLDPDNIIYNYEYFKQAYQDIQALDNQIATQEAALASFEKDSGNRKDMDREDKIEDARLRSIVSGMKNQRATQIAEYNARASMVNRNIFKSGTPAHLE